MGDGNCSQQVTTDTTRPDSPPPVKQPRHAILHITCGAPAWDPTPEDLVEISRVFKEAVLRTADSPIIVTRAGISAQLIDLTNATVEDVKVVVKESEPPTL